jgi:hypothetical protein
LKGSRWLWLTNPENLEEDQLQQLTALRAQFTTWKVSGTNTWNKVKRLRYC